MSLTGRVKGKIRWFIEEVPATSALQARTTDHETEFMLLELMGFEAATGLNIRILNGHSGKASRRLSDLLQGGGRRLPGHDRLTHAEHHQGQE